MPFWAHKCPKCRDARRPSVSAGACGAPGGRSRRSFINLLHRDIRMRERGDVASCEVPSSLAAKVVHGQKGFSEMKSDADNSAHLILGSTIRTDSSSSSCCSMLRCRLTYNDTQTGMNKRSISFLRCQTSFCRSSPRRAASSQNHLVVRSLNYGSSRSRH